MTFPDFIIIGAMKSATTSLHAQLAAQPGVFMSEPKEPNFFSDDDEYRRGLSYYSGLFAGARTGDLCGESSTHYTKRPDYPNTVTRMKAVLPKVKLIYVMRHPIERLVSHYVHQWTQNVIRCGIDEALDRHPELIAYSRYAYQLEPYVEAYERTSILPVFVQALRHAPQRELERIARHIGLSTSVSWRGDLGAQNLSSDRFRRFSGYELVVDSAPMQWLRRALVPQSVRDWIKGRLTMNEKPVLQRDSLARLESIFDEDLADLSAMFGTELSCATFDRLTAEGSLEWQS